MILTKEIMLHMAIGGSITGAIFVILFSSGSMVLDELEMTVFADAKILNNHILLSYIIQNTGDYDIQNVTVTIPYHSYTKTLVDTNSTHLIQILESNEFFDIIPMSNVTSGDEIILQFDAYDTMGHHDVDILTVLLE